MDSIRVYLFLFLFSFTLTGCMVGPNFHTPKAPNVERYNAKPLPTHTASVSHAGSGGKAQTFVYDRDLPADWWQMFHSKEINQLVEAGIHNSPNIDAAQAALRVAQETLNQQIGNLLFPAFNGQGQGYRQRVSGLDYGSTGASQITNVFNVSVNVAYTLDVFGGSRRQLEALAAQVDYQQFQLLATYLTLTSNIVTTAITIASYDAQITTTKELIQVLENQLSIIRKQYAAGGVANTNVLTQVTLVEQTRATLPQLEKALSQAEHAMDTLIGAYPDNELPVLRLNKLTLPGTLPVTVPSQLVRQRPDIRGSEALLHAASAQIGVATANLFPIFQIGGNYGYTGTVPSSLFAPINKTWALGMQVSQPLFHGGALFAARRVAIAQFDQAMAQYKQTLLTAFQNTADSLRALETDARTYRDAEYAARAADDNFRITSMQYREGGVSYLNLLTAQQQYLQTKLNAIKAKAQRYADTVALYQSLGGGWWNRKYIQCPDPLNSMNASLKCP